MSVDEHRPDNELDLGQVKDEFEEILAERAEQMSKEALEGGARYRSPITTDASDAGDDLSRDAHGCQNCGASVTAGYHRTNSDNDGVLWHCLECVTQSDMKNGAGAKPDFVGRCENTGGASYGSQ